MATVSSLDDRKTFLLGVGAQKAGTAWLHDHVSSSPECAAGFLKEYHVWDGLDLDVMAHFRERAGTRARKAGARVTRGEPATADDLRLAAFYADPETYVDYFELLLSRPGIRVTADITPSYAMLSAERLADVRDRFARRGIRVAPVFLMREPAERIWSAVRMYRERRPDRDVPAPEERVLEVFDSPWFEERTRYERTMDRLESVFGREGVFYALYERLFEDSTMQDLATFLGMEPHAVRTERRLNASPKSGALHLPDETAQRIARHYRTTYDAVAERVGRDQVAASWPDHRWLIS